MADTSYTDLLNGSAVAAEVDGLLVINSATTFTLTAGPDAPLAKIIEATFTATGQQLRTPDARLLSLGGNPTIVINKGTNAFSLRTNSGATEIINIGGGAAFYVYCTNNATVDGVFAARIQGVGSTADIASALAGFGLDAVAGQLAVDAQAIAGAGLVASAPQSQLDVNVDNSTLEISSDQLRVKALGITGAQIADNTITLNKLDPSVSVVAKFSAEATGLATSGTLVVNTPGVPATNARFNRFVQVVEETAGSPSTDTTWDFDLADRSTYDIETSTPAAALTPTDNGTTSSSWTQPTAATYPQLGAVTVHGTIEFAPGGAYAIPGRTDGATMAFFSRQLNYLPNPTLFPFPGLVESTPTTATIYSGVANDDTGKLIKLSSNKFIRAITNPTASEIKFESFTLDTSGNFTSIGTLTLSQATAASKMSFCPITATTALITYSDGTATTLRARIITVPDVGNPTAGVEQTTTMTASTNYRLCQTDVDKFVLAYNNATTSVIARVITLSGSTLTFGGETTIDSSAVTSATVYDIAPLGTTSFVVLALAFNTPNVRNCREITATFSGTIITTQSASTLADSGVNSQVGSVVRISATKALVSYRVGSSPPTLAVRNYTTISSPITDSTAGTSAANANIPILGFDSTNNVAFAYHPTSSTAADVFRYSVNVTTGVLSTLAVTVDQGYNCALSAPIVQTSWLGNVVSGNSGYVRITDFTQNATGGTAISSAGTPANGFDDNAATTVAAGANGWVGYDFGSPQTVRIAGLRVDTTGTYNLIIEGAIDSVFTAPVILHTPGVVRLTASQIYWFQLSNPLAFRYIRIRETGGATFTVQDTYFNFGTSVRAQTAFADFASLAAITTGNWTLNPTVFTPAGVATDASDTNEVLITTNTSQVNAANWEDVDSLTPVTETARIKNLTYPYVLGRGNPVSPANLYGVEPGQFLFTPAWVSTQIAQLTSTKFIVAGFESPNYRAAVLTRSGNSFTVGPIFTIGAGVSGASPNLLTLDSTRAIFLWRGTGSVNRAVVLTETSGTLSAGASVILNSTSDFRAVLESSSRVIVVGENNALPSLRAQVLTITGTVITPQTDYLVDNTGSSSYTDHGLVRLGTDKYMAQYFVSSTSTLRCVVMTVNPITNVITVGSPVNITTGYINNSGTLTELGTDRALSTYNSAAALGQLGRVITVSGTVPTLQATTVVVPGTQTVSSTGNRTVKIDNNNVFYVLDSVDGNQIVWVKINGNTVIVGDSTISQGNSAISSRSNMILNGTEILHCPTNSADTSTRIAFWNYADWSPVVAFSFNGRSTWRIWQLESGSLRNIASSLASVHGGTDGVWHFQNASNVWVPASINTQRQALKEAFLVQVNRTPAGFYTQLTDANWNTFGWTKSATSTINLAVGLDATNSELSQLTWGFTSRSQWNMMAEDAYRRNLELETQVTITKLNAGPSNVKANVVYVT